VIRASDVHHPSLTQPSCIRRLVSHGGGRALPPTPALTHNGTQSDPYKRSRVRWVCIFFTVTQSFEPKLVLAFDTQDHPAA